jgi:hypothetical protein
VRARGGETRYGGERPHAATWFWRDAIPFAQLDRGRALVIEGAEPFNLEYSVDADGTWTSRDSVVLGLSMHGVRFASAELADCRAFRFRRAGQPEQTIAIAQSATA